VIKIHSSRGRRDAPFRAINLAVLTRGPDRDTCPLMAGTVTGWRSLPSQPYGRLYRPRLRARLSQSSTSIPASVRRYLHLPAPRVSAYVRVHVCMPRARAREAPHSTYVRVVATRPRCWKPAGFSPRGEISMTSADPLRGIAHHRGIRFGLRSNLDNSRLEWLRGIPSRARRAFAHR
jgi:hypothetical protein